MKTYLRNTQGRLFQNNFLEAASKVHPITPVILYGPVVVGTLWHALANRISTFGQVVAFFALGWVTWCFMEYAIRRYFFHWEGNGPFTRRVHDIVHGYHHLYPDDPLRLVMPLGASIPLAIIVGGLLYLLGRPAATGH